MSPQTTFSVASRTIAAPLASAYDPDQGRLAVSPEVLVRALVIRYAYAIPSFRRLCAGIEENLAFTWFLFLGLEDEVFDPSTITVFLRRLGPATCRGLLARLGRGESTPPWGVPAFEPLPPVRVFRPSASVSSTGALSHILIRRSIFRSLIRRATDFMSSGCGMVWRVEGGLAP